MVLQVDEEFHLDREQMALDQFQLDEYLNPHEQVLLVHSNRTELPQPHFEQQVIQQHSNDEVYINITKLHISIL